MLVGDGNLGLLLGPLVLTANLILLLGREVVLDVEGFTDLFGGLALDHVGDGLAADVEESFDVEVVGSLCRIIYQIRSSGNTA